RLEHEIELIVRMGFDAYYLIVWDFIRWARDKGIPVGPGRGSGAGSLVAYAIGVTDVDPIRYGLLFERFLNPERVNPPDFDIDFCQNRRDEVIDYVGRKYGHEYVGQIITYSQLKAKAAIRDVARVIGLSFSEGDRVAKLIPIHPKMTLEKALKQEPKLEEMINGPEADPRLQELWRIAEKLEGLSRQPGKHAAGVVIADRPISEYAPLYKTEDGVIVTQFNMKDLDAVGLIKFDFLGLTALTIIDNAVKWIRARREPDFRVEDIPLDDPATYELLAAGTTAGVFQLESRGITDLVRRVRPDCVDDIIAILALYRPGPLGGGMKDDFILCKHGEKKVKYPIPELEPILKETHGVILYQEQVMRIASKLAGFSMGRADLLRRAMGKKKIKELESHREPFIEGAKSRGVDEKKARDLFQKMEFFAEYGFNKSHSAAYAFVTLRTAYLKAHFPAEFLCAILTAEKGDQDKLTLFIHEARDLGVDVLLPDVNRSQADFTVEDTKTGSGEEVPAIRFGLGAVKGVGDKAVEVILEAREQGPFEDFMDFLVRVDPRKVNRRVIEALIKSGALDCFEHTRRAMVEGLERLSDLAQNRRAERDSGQMGLFDADADQGLLAGGVNGPPDLPEWPVNEKLALERAAIGNYISGHPMDPYVDELRTKKVKPIGGLAETVSNKSTVSVAGIVVQRTEKLSKNGDRMAFVTLEDTTGQVECKIWPRFYEEWSQVAGGDEPLLVTGKVTIQGDSDFEVASLEVNSVARLDAARGAMADSVMVRMDLDGLREAQIDRLSEAVKRHPGKCALLLVLRLKGKGEIHLRAESSWSVDPSDSTLRDLEEVMGPSSVGLW
ncbi:MAG: DNA polymerase III subunit alpha, partial [Deltaproteobacteria bacterium]|nr:DNA polymerase III subunit alpha [Deltaproteobacteria bacterium]